MDGELSVVTKGEVVFFADGETYQSPTTVRPATPAEIKSAHGTCQDCKQRTYTYDDFCMLTGYCITDLTNYCKHWEAK